MDPTEAAPIDTAYLFARVRASNAQARQARERWSGHRERVMAVMRELPIAGARVALLGAGHLHDVAFEELLGECAHVDLVDLDAETVRAAVCAVPHAARSCTIHAPVDLTGALHVLPRAAGEDGVRQVAAHLSGARCVLRGAPFDVTVSLGVLTQLMQAVSDAGVAAGDVPALSLAVRDKHLRDLVALTRPGGAFVLVTDFVSTATAPELLGLDAGDLEPRLAALVARGNFFTGTNPFRILALLEDRETLGRDVAGARFVGPWLWPVTAERQHLTGAIVGRRA